MNLTNYINFVISAISSLISSDYKFKDIEPLYLTPYIESHRIQEAREAAKVRHLAFQHNIKSYSGLLTVDKTHGSNMFFWYFPSEHKADEVPLVIWLNGYSTASSYGVYLQNGPYDLLHSRIPERRNTSWHKFYNVLYIDNPVGVGFSFTGTDDGYSKSVDELSDNLFGALEQFLQLFPELSQQELYITGLSLGGKYVVSLAYRIFKQNSLNLKGIFLGDPGLNPAIQFQFDKYLFQLGFIDKNQRKEMNEIQNQLLEVLEEKDYARYYDGHVKFLLDEESYILNITGLKNVYNYNSPYIDHQYYDEFIKSARVRRALHVGDLKFNEGSRAMETAMEVFGVSVTELLEEMVETVDMMFYAGQMDVIIAYPMLVDTLSSMKWTGRKGYIKAERELLKTGDWTWGYLRNHRTLSDVMVRQAGHSAVTDQPQHILHLLNRFTRYHRFTQPDSD